MNKAWAVFDSENKLRLILLTEEKANLRKSFYDELTKFNHYIKRIRWELDDEQ